MCSPPLAAVPAQALHCQTNAQGTIMCCSFPATLPARAASSQKHAKGNHVLFILLHNVALSAGLLAKHCAKQEMQERVCRTHSCVAQPVQAVRNHNIKYNQLAHFLPTTCTSPAARALHCTRTAPHKMISSLLGHAHTSTPQNQSSTEKPPSPPSVAATECFVKEIACLLYTT